MIGRGDGWTSTYFTEMSLQVQFLDNRSNGHRDFSLRIQEWRIQYTYREQSGRAIIVQCQHGDLRQRLAWDPGIAGLSISLTGKGEWTIAGESYSNFPLSFIVERSASLASVLLSLISGITRRSCLEAHMVLDMEYREQERPEHGPGGPIFFFSVSLVLSAVPASITTGLGLHLRRLLLHEVIGPRYHDMCHI
jgi:hypothetical protein